MTRRRTFVAGLVAAVLAGVAAVVSVPGASAQSYPAHEVEFVVPFPPGGPADTFARLVQPVMSAKLRVPIVITTRSGGGGALGASYVANAKPDGYTVLATTNSPLSVVPATRQVPYQPGSFTAVGQAMLGYQFVAVKAGAPWKTLDALIDYAKKNPGKLSYGSPGLGTISFFNMEVLKQAAGIDLVHVPLSGSGPLKTAILGGHVAVMADASAAVVPLVRSGDLVALVTTAPRRLPELPEVPTTAEKGLARVSLSTRVGLFVPARTPPAAIATLAAALQDAANDPGVVAAAEKAGMVAEFRDGAALREIIDADFRAVAETARQIGLKP